MKTQITIDRFPNLEPISKENWKDLISALVLAGYEVYGDDERIIFCLGDSDTIQEVDK